jgi:tripeptide aminopeptidase
VPAVSRAAANPVQQLAEEPRVARALLWLEKNTAWVTEQQARITEIPAPPFEEEKRGQYVRKLLESAGLRVRVDDIGNVIAERGGTQARDVVLVTAHLDTVFPPGTETRVRREGRRLIAPGISDNGTGLATLVALAHALAEGKPKTKMTIVFAANVGEEGEGNLRGMRKLVESFRDRLRAVIVIDGSSTGHITSRALASRRFEAVVSGPGGHSWSDFGLPNPIHALARGITRFARARVPEQPRTSINVGQIEGGTSVNSIPYRASSKVDIRSESSAEIERLEAALREAIQGGADEEMSAARLRHAKLEVEIKVIGERPGGELADDAPLVEAVRSVDRFLGNRARLERSSTDANVPLSLGIPAVAIGGGGEAGAAHSLNEWYDPAGREIGLKRALLTVLRVAGVQ